MNCIVASFAIDVVEFVQVAVVEKVVLDFVDAVVVFAFVDWLNVEVVVVGVVPDLVLVAVEIVDFVNSKFVLN